MKFAVPASVTRPIGRTVLRGKIASPKLLFVGGVVGMVGTTVLASRATLKFRDIMDEHEKNVADAGAVLDLKREDYDQKDYDNDVRYLKMKTATTIVKLYAPPVALGIVSIAMLTKSHVMLTKRNVALAAAYATLEKAFETYRSRVIMEQGAEKDREYFYGTEERTVVTEGKNGPKKKVEKVISTNPTLLYGRLFDARNDNWQGSRELNRPFLQSQQNRANDRLHARGHITLNEVYDMLGYDRTPEGMEVGWIMDEGGTGDNYVDFGCFSPEHNGWNEWAIDENGKHGHTIRLDFNVDGNIINRLYEMKERQNDAKLQQERG